MTPLERLWNGWRATYVQSLKNTQSKFLRRARGLDRNLRSPASVPPFRSMRQNRM